MGNPIGHRQSGGLRDRLRIVNKYVTNPVMMFMAGREHWYASVVHHVGRRTGRHYATPVVAVPVADGFLVPLPYGTGTDWARNVLHAGEARLTTSGRTFRVRPALVDADRALGELPATRARTFRALGITEYLGLRDPAEVPEVAER